MRSRSIRRAADRETLFVHPPQWYAEQDIDLLLDTTVTAIDRLQRTAAPSNGECIGYDRLLLTTGASPRRLRVSGADLDGVLHLRVAGGCERIHRTFETSSHMIFVGGGRIGLEVAAAARGAGVKVTVLEADALCAAARIGVVRTRPGLCAAAYEVTRLRGAAGTGHLFPCGFNP